jgi:hypothetical protein
MIRTALTAGDDPVDAVDQQRAARAMIFETTLAAIVGSASITPPVAGLQQIDRAE